MIAARLRVDVREGAPQIRRSGQCVASHWHKADAADARCTARAWK
jgi:hypothetical protein